MRIIHWNFRRWKLPIPLEYWMFWTMRRISMPVSVRELKKGSWTFFIVKGHWICASRSFWSWNISNFRYPCLQGFLFELRKNISDYLLVSRRSIRLTCLILFWTFMRVEGTVENKMPKTYYKYLLLRFKYTCRNTCRKSISEKKRKVLVQCLDNRTLSCNFEYYVSKMKMRNAYFGVASPESLSWGLGGPMCVVWCERGPRIWRNVLLWFDTGK
jgi:hypothetical protein